MPIYEYQCLDCQSNVEVLVRNSEKPICPKCGKARLEKQFSVIAAPVAHQSSQSSSEGMCGRPQCMSGGCQGFSD